MQMRKFSCTNGAYIFNTRETKGLAVEVNPAWEELQEILDTEGLLKKNLY